MATTTATTGPAANATAATTGPFAVSAGYGTDIDAAATTAYPAWWSTCANANAATTTVPSRPTGVNPAAPLAGATRSWQQPCGVASSTSTGTGHAAAAISSATDAPAGAVSGTEYASSEPGVWVLSSSAGPDESAPSQHSATAWLAKSPTYAR